MPKNFVIAGSNNGTTWYLIKSYSNTTYDTNISKIFNFTTATSYNYFRLITTAVTMGDMAGPTELNLRRWDIFGSF
jgi:hypothetical protein